MSQQQTHHGRSGEDDEELESALAHDRSRHHTDSGHTSTSDYDDVLAEIEEVLEENAEDFVKAYVQKGGQ
jgi:ubiquitin-like protein Pup